MPTAMVVGRVWYGLCTYWTENFSKLLGPGVPLCPVCRSPGFEATAEEWNGGLEPFEADHPGYVAVVAANREICHGRGVKILDLWRMATGET